MTQAPDESSQNTPPDPREMYAEISAVVAAIAKAFAMTESDVAAALETGAMTLSFGEDTNGNRFVTAATDTHRARIYRGAIKHEDTPS